VDFETGEADWVYKAREWEESDNYAEGGYFVLNPLSGYPCVVDDKFYIGRSQDPGYIYCVSLDAGELLWKKKVQPEWIDDWVDTAPAYADGRLYYGWGGKDPEWDDQSNAGWYLSCISADNGEPIWDFKLDDRVATIPFVIGGRVYFGASDGYFYCLE
jgi:outer membrane protein assembly factor BamB